MGFLCVSEEKQWELKQVKDSIKQRMTCNQRREIKKIERGIISLKVDETEIEKMGVCWMALFFVMRY